MPINVMGNVYIGTQIEHADTVYIGNNGNINPAIVNESATIHERTTEPQPNFPQENHYAEVVRWLEQQKPIHDYVREANNNIADLARKLSDIFGWQVEDHQLRKALNRGNHPKNSPK